jgi:hypothetical protein
LEAGGLSEMKYMTLKDFELAKKLEGVFNEILMERIRQNEKWGEQNHPMTYKGFDYLECKQTLEIIRTWNDRETCWRNVLAEEFLEAFAETDPEKQREEMIQVAAVAVQIIEYLDRKREAETDDA